MHLTRAADYAVRVMVEMASLPAGSRASLSVLAEATAAPESFLSKVLQMLSRADLVGSRRGPDGGFVLLREATGITLLEVVEAIDGPVRLNECLGNGDGCERAEWCAAHLVWAQAQEAMTAILRRATIAQLAEQSALRRRLLAKDKRPKQRSAAINLS